MSLEGESLAVDAVAVWRIVDSRIVGVWDIPSVYAAAAQPPG